MFEGVPTHPTVSRCWEIIDKYSVSHFYTAPTAIRSLMSYGDEPVSPLPCIRVRVSCVSVAHRVCLLHIMCVCRSAVHHMCLLCYIRERSRVHEHGRRASLLSTVYVCM